MAIKTSYSFGDDGLSLSGRHDFKWTDLNVLDPGIIILKALPRDECAVQAEGKALTVSASAPLDGLTRGDGLEVLSADGGIARVHTEFVGPRL